MSLSKQWCDVCDLSFTSYQHYSIHLGGLLHNQKKRRKLEGEDDSMQRAARIMDSKLNPSPASSCYAGTYVDSVSTGLHSCLKRPKSSVISVPCDTGLASSSQRSHHSGVTVASSQTASLRSAHLKSYSEFASPNDSYYKDNQQLDKRDLHGWESHSSQDLPRREMDNLPHANKTKEALTKASSSVTYGSKEKSSILALLAAQRLLLDNPLEKKSPKKPIKVEVKSKDSVRSLLSAQFDLLKSYMTEPQKPPSTPEPEKVRASRGQDLPRQKAAEWSGASRSTRVLPNRGFLETADWYSTDRSMGQRSHGSVKPPDFWSRQATYADEVQSDMSSIPFLGEGCAKDEGMLEEPPAFFLPRSRDQVAAGPWDRHDDDGFNTNQWNRPPDRSVADVSKRSEPKRSDVSSSNRTWQGHGHDTVKPGVSSDAWELREDNGLGRTAEKTYNDKRHFGPNEDNYSSELDNPLFSSENSRSHRPAVGAYQQHQVPGFRDDFRGPVQPLIEPMRSRSSMEEFMAQIKENLRRDLKSDSFSAKASVSEVRADFGRSYPVSAPLQPSSTTQRKVLLKTPSTSKPLGASSNVSTTSTVAKRKILLPTPIADPTVAQSSLTFSSTGISWSQPESRGGSQSWQQPRFSSLTPGGGRFICSESSTTMRPPAKKTLLSTPPASCLQPGSYSKSGSYAGVSSSVKQSPLPVALPAKLMPQSRNIGAAKNLVAAGACSKTSPSLPVKSALKGTTAAANKSLPSSGKVEAVSTVGPENSGMEEVDPHLRLQKEIEVVMAERVEDLMRAIPDSMMRSIMDGKIPLEFLDKISDLIPTEVIEEAVKQKEQSSSDKCTSAGGGHLKTGTSRMPLAGHQIAKPEANVTEVAMGLHSGGDVELVKKMIDEILGDLASETVAPENTDILERLAPDIRRMVLEMQEVAGIRDVSVTIEVLEFFKTLDHNLLITLSTINEAEKDGDKGESVLKRMTKLMLNNYSRNDPCASKVAGMISKNTQNTGLRKSVQPCVRGSSTSVTAQQNRVVAAKKSEVQSVSVTCVARQKSENPEIKAPLVSLSEKAPNAPCGTTGVVEKPGVKALQNKHLVSEISGVVTVSNVLQTVTTSTGKPGNKSYFLDYHNDNTGPGNTLPCVPHTKPGVARSSFSDASRVGVGSVKSELQGFSFNRQTEAETKIVASTLTNRNELSTVTGTIVSVNKSSSVGLAADSKDSAVSQNQKAGIAVVGKTELQGTSKGCLTNNSGILKTPEVGSSSAIKEQTTCSDKFGVGRTFNAVPSRTETIEISELKVPGSNAQNSVGDKVLSVTVTPGVRQARAAVATSTATMAAATSAMGAVTSSVVAKQENSSLTDKTDCDKLSEMGAKSVGQSVCSLDIVSAQLCALKVEPAEQLSNDKAEKRKATEEPLEQSKKAKLETIVSEKPALTSTASTAKDVPPKTSYVVASGSTAGTGYRCLLATPTQRPAQQSTRPRTVLLPTPVQPNSVSFISPRLSTWNRQQLSQAPFSTQQPLLPQAIGPHMSPGSLRQGDPPPVPHEQHLMSGHRMRQSSSHELLHPPERPPLMPQMREQAPLLQPRVGMWPLDAPFRTRNSVNFRPCLPDPSPNRYPPQPPMHASNSFRFPGPDSNSFGPPPFKRWR